MPELVQGMIDARPPRNPLQIAQPNWYFGNIARSQLKVIGQAWARRRVAVTLLAGITDITLGEPLCGMDCWSKLPLDRTEPGRDGMAVDKSR